MFGFWVYAIIYESLTHRKKTSNPRPGKWPFSTPNLKNPGLENGHFPPGIWKTRPEKWPFSTPNSKNPGLETNFSRLEFALENGYFPPGKWPFSRPGILRFFSCDRNWRESSNKLSFLVFYFVYRLQSIGFHPVYSPAKTDKILGKWQYIFQRVFLSTGFCTNQIFTVR